MRSHFDAAERAHPHFDEELGRLRFAMDIKHYSPTPDAPFAPEEPGYIVSSPCGRKWFIALEDVGRNYAEFRREADGLSAEEAKAEAETTRDTWHEWFIEQCVDWASVDSLGKLIARSQLLKTRPALDRARAGHEAEWVVVDLQVA
jgi:hypothetical protein